MSLRVVAVLLASVLTACGDQTAAPTSLAIDPAPFRLPAGTSAPIRAIALYSDGSTADVTAETTWLVDPESALIDTSTDTVRALRAGTVIVTANFEELTAETSLIVTDAFLATIEISPASVTLAAGIEQPLTAMGVFSDGSVQDLTLRVSWTADGNAASISSQGVVHGIVNGTATIIASSGAIRSTAPVVVTAALMTGLEFENPTGIPLPVGRTRQLVLRAVFSDGSAMNVSDAGLWSVHPPALAFVDTDGVVHGRVVGSAMITATLGSFSSSHSLEVGPAAVNHVVVFPPTISIAKGETHGFGAIGVFSDGTQRDITNEVSWTTTNPAVATVLNDTGVAVGLAAGSAVIRAGIGNSQSEATLDVTEP